MPIRDPIRASNSFCGRDDRPLITSLGRSPVLILFSMFAILRAFHACCIAPASHLAWRSIAISCGVFLFNPKSFWNFASVIDPASCEVWLVPRLRKADTLWKSSGFILNSPDRICTLVYAASLYIQLHYFLLGDVSPPQPIITD